MNYKVITKFISRIVAIEALLMVPSLMMALFRAEWPVFFAFLESIGIALAVAGIGILVSKNADRMFFTKEAMVCVGLSWMVMSLIGAFPFFLSREIPHFIDALFEIVSGFTTTGSSVLTDVEAMSKPLLLWRSLSHWIGGMGVLVFMMAILPSNSRDAGLNMQVMRCESPGPSVSKLVPKIRQSATILYSLYMGLTVLCFIFLIWDMPLFDAVCTALGTAGTGGFGILSDSIASYSPYVQVVVTVFMILFGVNFALYYLLLLRRFKEVLLDEELHLYIGVIISFALLIAWNIRDLYSSFGEALRYSFFQVGSVITTTGFATADFTLWPTLSQVLLVALMFLGACAGSTGGGFKCSRLLLIIKNIKRSIQSILHPQKVQTIRLNNSPIEEKTVTDTNTYLSVYFLLMILSCLVLGFDSNASFVTSVTAVIACLNNIGPGLGAVGPAGNFADFSILSKVVLIFDMLAGRLEIYPILLLFSYRTWSRKQG